MQVCFIHHCVVLKGKHCVCLVYIPLKTRHKNVKAKHLEKFLFLASRESLWTDLKGFLCHVNHPFNHGSYFDWFAFSKADQGCAIPFLANRLYI